MIFNFWKIIFLWRLFWSCNSFKLSSFLYKRKFLQIFFYKICGEVQPQEFFIIPLKHTQQFEIWSSDFFFSKSTKGKQEKPLFFQYLRFKMYEFILFWNFSGFFVCEDHILNTGGGLVSRGYLEEVWSGALTKENNHIKRGCRSNFEWHCIQRGACPTHKRHPLALFMFKNGIMVNGYSFKKMVT